jgi:hypothetical protein
MDEKEVRTILQMALIAAAVYLVFKGQPAKASSTLPAGVAVTTRQHAQGGKWSAGVANFGMVDNSLNFRQQAL